MLWTIYRRPKETDWLERNSRLSPILGVYGLPGVGKTTMVRTWLGDMNLRAKWYTVGRFSSLPGPLGFPEKSIESALELASESWSAYQAVVWDDLHHLRKEVLSTLISFLRSQPPRLHILISDESFEEILNAEVPRKKVEGFSLDEVQAYLESIKAADIRADRVWQASGGLPLLIQISLQDQVGNRSASWVRDNLGELYEKISCLALIGQPFGIAEVETLWPEAKAQELISRLQSKLLIESFGGGAGGKEQFQVPPYISGLMLAHLGADELKSAAEKILRLGTELNLWSRLFVASVARNSSVFAEAVNALRTDELEGLSSATLEHAQQTFAVGEELGLGNNASLSRLRLKALVLQGRRSEALQFGRDKVKVLKSKSELSLAEEELVYDLVHWLNRGAQHDEAAEWIRFLMPKAKASLQNLLRIEQSLPYVESDPQRALEGLQRTLKAIEALKNGGDRESLVARAQVLYQIANSSFHLGIWQEAIEAYSESEKLYQKADRPYFAAFCRINKVWIYFEQRKFELFQSELKTIESDAKRYSYPYVEAGVDLAYGMFAFLNCEFGSALSKISLALDKISKVGSARARLDALVEKARVLNFVGQNFQAKKVFESAKAIAMTPAIESLAFELFADDLQLEDLQEYIGKHENALGTEHLFAMALELGVASVPLEIKNRLTLHKRGRLALAQQELLSAIQNSEDLWGAVSNLDQVLLSIAEPRPERVALLCLKAALSEAEESRMAALDDAEVELARWGADEVLKRPLQAWIGCIRDNSKLEKKPLWKASRPIDRERWGGWTRGAAKKSKYLILSRSGAEPVDTVPKKIDKTSLWIMTETAEVKFKGKSVPELYKKPMLRQILFVLLEGFPQAVGKAGLAGAVWGESYNPLAHDARIYTSVQRLRELLGEKAIESWQGGYRWNPKIEFYYFKSQSVDSNHTPIELLILETLRKHSQMGRTALKRLDLVEAAQASESTVKRALSKLLSEGKVTRSGSGPNILYKLNA